jgi:phage terminase small subunit
MKSKAPEHLTPATRAWVEAVLDEYDLEAHHIRLLTLAAESWDRCQQAREALAVHGLIFVDRLGQPRARPEVPIERDARISFARLIRELGLDVDAPEAPRSGRIPSNSSRKRG